MAHLLRGYVVGTVTLGLAASIGVGASPAASAAGAVNTNSVAQIVVPRAGSKLPFKESSARYGARSKSVKNMQRLLIRKGFATRGLARAGTTGSYYDATKASVKKLQRRSGISRTAATGIIEKRSAKRLGLKWVVDTAPASIAGSQSLPQGTNGDALTPLQLKGVLQAAGFIEPSIRTAYGIAMRESRAYPRVVSRQNSNGTRDHGLFQINDVHRSTTDFTNIYDAVFNAQVAFRLSRSGADFSAWGIGTSGWAGTLKATNPTYWQFLQDEMVRFRNQYPG